MRTIQITFHVEWVENGYIIIVGNDFRSGEMGKRFVFNELSDAQDFITNHLENA